MSDVRVGFNAGVTANLGDFQSLRIDVSVQGIDPEMDLDEQLELVTPKLEALKEFVMTKLDDELVASAQMKIIKSTGIR